MDKSLTYELHNPKYTIYHRAALGGLAATIKAFKKTLPVGLKNADVKSDYVRLTWSDELNDEDVLGDILNASFKIFKTTNDSGLIDLPGQGITRPDLRLAVHNGLMETFLQWGRFRKGDPPARSFPYKTADGESLEDFVYLPVKSYHHQTGLEKLKRVTKNGGLDFRPIPQWIVPGAFQGARPLEAPVEEVFLLLFLMVGCGVFFLYPRTYKNSARYCIIIPDVIDLDEFADALQEMASTASSIKRFSSSFWGRNVGGVEEAALRFLIDLKAGNIKREQCVAGCQAVAMGRVPWDKKQKNRSLVVRLGANYPEIAVFKSANSHLSKARKTKTKKGETILVPTSHVPELIAANLAAERHWCARFVELVTEKQDFESLLYDRRGGLQAMRDAVKDAEDKAIIGVFQQAWKRTQAELANRARNEGYDDPKIIWEDYTKPRCERIRNEILRAKMPDQLAAWFLQFCADATEGDYLPSLRSNQEIIRRFIFDPHNFERLRNLCFFALLSYGGD